MSHGGPRPGKVPTNSSKVSYGRPMSHTGDLVRVKEGLAVAMSQTVDLDQAKFRLAVARSHMADLGRVKWRLAVAMPASISRSASSV